MLIAFLLFFKNTPRVGEVAVLVCLAIIHFFSLERVRDFQYPIFQAHLRIKPDLVRNFVKRRAIVAPVTRLRPLRLSVTLAIVPVLFAALPARSIFENVHIFRCERTAIKMRHHVAMARKAKCFR